MFQNLLSARENVVERKAPIPKKKVPETIKHQLRNFAPRINRFGSSTLRKLAIAAEGGNVAVASGSLFVLLGALSRASVDEDTEEACEALFGKTPTNLDKLAKEMAKSTDDQISYKWIVVSSVWLPSDRRLDKDFAEKLDDKFDVKVQKMAATKDPRRVIELVNKLHREESEDRLTDMIPSEQKDVGKNPNGMIAAVGVYFHPWWRSRFERSLTTKDMFHESKEAQYQVSTMHRESTMPYVQADLCPGIIVEMAGIPCRGDGATVYFVVPVKWYNLDEVVSHLTGDRAAQLIGYCRPRRVRASIPKLHMSFSSELRKTFSALGVDAWLNTNHPAFDGLVKRGGAVSLGEAYHQVVIKLNEEGDQVASDAVVDTSEPAVDFRCNQPFVILLHNTATNAIWMLAQIKRPSVLGPQPPVPVSSNEAE